MPLGSSFVPGRWSLSFLDRHPRLPRSGRTFKQPRIIGRRLGARGCQSRLDLFDLHPQPASVAEDADRVCFQALSKAAGLTRDVGQLALEIGPL